jgi:MFS family permease
MPPALKPFDPPPVWRVHLLRAGDRLATAVTQYAVPVLVYQLTGSVGWAGLAFAAEWTPRLAAIGAGGPLVDRFPPRTVMLVATLFRAVVVLAGMGALATGSGALTVVAVGVGCGLLADVAYLAAEALGAAAGRGPTAARVQAVQTSIDQGTLLIGPLIGGALLLTGPQVALGAIVILSLATAMIAMTVRTAPRAASEAAAAGGVRGLRGGAQALRAAPTLCWMVAAGVGMNLLAGLLQAATPVLVTGFGRSPAATGAVWSISAAACLLAAITCARFLDRAGPVRITIAASLTAAVAAAAAGMAGSYLQFTAAMALLAAAEGIALVALRTVRARLLPQNVFGSAVAVMVLLLLIPMPVSGVLLALVPEPHLPLLLLAAALTQAGVTATAARGLRRHRHTLNTPTY